MIETNLYTKDGNFVATVLVPPFMKGAEADVLVWGERFFLRHNDGLYRECFAVATFTREEFEKIKASGAVRVVMP